MTVANPVPTVAEWSEFRDRLFRRTGLDLDDYKPAQMRRRVAEVMEARGHTSLGELWAHLERSPAHIRAFVDRVAINVSEMFRNPEKWAELPAVIRDHAALGSPRMVCAVAEKVGLGSPRMVRAVDGWVSLGSPRMVRAVALRPPTFIRSGVNGVIEIGFLGHGTNHPWTTEANPTIHGTNHPWTTGLRVWSAGCSHGAEAYSVAMMLQDHFPGDHRILGTDIDQAALKRARRAIYADSETTALPARYRERFLVDRQEGWSVKPDLRSLVQFRHGNLLNDPPSGQFDLILCRNVSIYFTEAAKVRLAAALAGALVPGGVLFVGTSEGFDAARWFEPILPGFYRRTDAP